ncbi:MAG: vWA domain-containing protein [Candidatus Acidiferrales bacterium]
MNRIQFKFMIIVFLFACTFWIAAPLLAQGVKPSSPDLVQMTVTAAGRSGAKPPALERIDVSVHQDNRPRPVVNLIPANSPKASLDFVILVDDSLNTALGTQFSDIKNFIRSLPEGSRVAVAYAANGTATMQQDFTTDRAAAEKAIRLPNGQFQGSSGIYFAVDDLIKKWPEGAARREVLLISDGIDLSYGVDATSPGLNSPLEQAISAAQRNNITIYSLFASGAGIVARNGFLILNGQGCLGKLTLDTGGDSFFLGFQTPVAFRPFLQQLTELLGQQYLLTFRAALPQKAGFHDLKVSTEMSGVELMAPSRIYLPERP